MKNIFFLMIVLSTVMIANMSRSDTGVVADSNTGLVWQDDYSDNEGNIKEAKWYDAIEYCENLSLGNRDGWRLPNIRELKSIVDRNLSNPAIDPAFQNITMDHYWTSTTKGRSADAWIVNFRYGDDLYTSKSHSYHVRCVCPK